MKKPTKGKDDAVACPDYKIKKVITRRGIQLDKPWFYGKPMVGM